mgnify:CR=1 FL=1
MYGVKSRKSGFNVRVSNLHYRMRNDIAQGSVLSDTEAKEKRWIQMTNATAFMS